MVASLHNAEQPPYATAGIQASPLRGRGGTRGRSSPLPSQRRATSYPSKPAAMTRWRARTRAIAPPLALPIVESPRNEPLAASPQASVDPYVTMAILHSISYYTYITLRPPPRRASIGSRRPSRRRRRCCARSSRWVEMPWWGASGWPPFATRHRCRGVLQTRALRYAARQIARVERTPARGVQGLPPSCSDHSVAQRPRHGGRPSSLFEGDTHPHLFVCAPAARQPVNYATAGPFASR